MDKKITHQAKSFDEKLLTQTEKYNFKMNQTIANSKQEYDSKILIQTRKTQQLEKNIKLLEGALL